MSSLREIRKRLRSIQNIGQLTKAMEMVAASHLHQAQARIQQTLTYSTKIKEIVDSLTNNLTDFVHPLVEKKKQVKKIGVIVVAADMGLSGSYNKDVFSATDKFLRDHTKEQLELILIGRKAVEHYSRRDWTIRFKNPKMVEAKKNLAVKSLTSQLIHEYIKGDLDEVWLAHTQYISMFSKKVIIQKLLNIEISADNHKDSKLNYIFEPTPEIILGEILLRYVFAKVQASLDEAYASELAARVFAMKAATKNADDMIEKLTLIRNKVRQTEITKEMLEITAGAESAK
ncbi:MAG TPA: ATP synthase F1 subunit gamma [Parachlamydiaceae bacterium]|nr:ATP synthase F1 subunit gamma [Parachlamydiaceae bacterium]